MWSSHTSEYRGPRDAGGHPRDEPDRMKAPQPSQGRHGSHEDAPGHSTLNASRQASRSSSQRSSTSMTDRTSCGRDATRACWTVTRRTSNHQCPFSRSAKLRRSVVSTLLATFSPAQRAVAHQMTELSRSRQRTPKADRLHHAPALDTSVEPQWTRHYHDRRIGWACWPPAQAVSRGPKAMGHSPES